MTPGPRTHAGARLEIKSMPLPEGFDEPKHVVQLVGLYTEPDKRRRGDATWLMCEVCVEANESKTVIVLEPEPGEDGPLDAAALESFYRRFGFEKIQSEPIVLMARRPR